MQSQKPTNRGRSTPRLTVSLIFARARLCFVVDEKIRVKRGVMRVRQAWTRILDLDGYRVKQVGFKTEAEFPRLWIDIERRGVKRYRCSGCNRPTGRVRDAKLRAWDDLPWGANRVTLRYRLRRLNCRGCGIRTERIGFADPKARVTRRLRQQIGLDCQSMPVSHAAVRHGVSWSKARRAEYAFLKEWV
jgi:transposase